MKSIAIVLFDDVEVLDFAGPFEVFSITGRRKIGTPFEVFTVAERERVVARNGLTVTPTFTFSDCPETDMILVPGGGGYHADGTPFGTRREMENAAMIQFVKDRASKAKLVLSVCTGALILARADMLKGKEATTHHLAVDLLRRIAPETTVHAGRRVVDNGDIILSAGVSAGIDMSFHVIAKLQGAEVAKESATYMEYDSPHIV